MAKAPEKKPFDISVIGRKVKSLELGKSSELLANQKTFSHKNADMTICEKGVHVISKKTGEEALIFDADCVVAKFLPREE